MGMTPKDPQGEQEEMKEVVEEQIVSTSQGAQSSLKRSNSLLYGKLLTESEINKVKDKFTEEIN